MHGTKRPTMSRLRVKPEHAPYRVSADRIRIGGVSYGTAAEIADPDGWVWSLLGAMDGTREPDEIVTAVLRSHPGLAEGTVRAGTQQLVSSGYVEDAGAAYPDCLTEREIQRYDRAVRYYRWLDMTPRASSWDPQVLLRRATVTVLGVGGTGGVAALALAAGTSYAIGDFVAELDDMGFLDSVGGKARIEPAWPPQSIRWLKPGHVSWLLHPAVPYAAAVPVLAVAALAAARPSLIPTFHSLAWNRHSGLVLAINVAISWVLTGLHELGHLAVGRAAGVPTRISLSTRMQFLVVQTDISGLWAARRRTRITAYLAGMTVDLLVASGALLIVALADPHGLTRALLSVTAALGILAIPFQFMVFTRTDLYFVIQDLTKSTSLHADGAAYLRHLFSRAAHAANPAAARRPDPTLPQPRYQRRVIRGYSAVLVTGVITCVAVEAVFFIPSGLTLVWHAILEMCSRAPIAIADGVTALTVIVFLLLVRLIIWWRRNRSFLRAQSPGARSTHLPTAAFSQFCRMAYPTTLTRSASRLTTKRNIREGPFTRENRT